MKIALLGYGLEGESAYNYLRSLHPSAEIFVYDQAETTKQELPTDVTFVGGVKDFHDIDADLVVRTPSIRPDAVTSKGEITSVTKLFFDACPAPIIGVTGSKGKGTTASLTASILHAGGYTSHLVGNIGEPALDVLAKVQSGDVVVYELSSFQLWDLEKSPQVGVVLMIEADHMDIHSGMDEYVAAKANIAKYQQTSNTLVFNGNNEYARAIAKESNGEKIPYPSQQYAHIEGDYFYYGATQLCLVSALHLPGEHNIENACAAITAAWAWVQDGEAIAQGLRDFSGLPHRLKFVREVGEVKYYDDSIATTPGSAIAALRAFTQPKVVILGGSSKGADFTELAQEIVKSTIRRIIVMGSEADNIAVALDAVGVSDYCLMREATMRDVVARAEEVAEPGDVVVLSPACASFGMFKNYKDRGEQFIAAVEEL